MNRKTHPSEESFDELCREIVKAAQASEEEIQAAAQAPFLYQRLRAQIAAEQKPIATIALSRSSEVNFVAAFRAFANRWRWALAATALAVLVLAVGVRWHTTAAPQIAAQQPTPAIAPQPALPGPTVTLTPDHLERVPALLQIANKIRANKSVHNRPLHVVATASTKVEEAEITTEFLPLTYSANQDNQQGQIVRMEMPRSVLATMGVPTANITGDRVKADVMLGDDGVALAIRFIQ